jgi:Fic family protein
MNNLSKRILQLPQSNYLLISRIDELKGRWVGGLNLSPQILNRLKRSVLASSAGASTRIEGSKLSDEEVESLMRGLTMQKMADRDAQEVRGYYEVLQTVFDSYADIPFSESSILHLHSQLLKYSEKDERRKGRYKNLENSVEMRDQSGVVLSVLFETTPAYLTPKEMQELVAWTQTALQAKENHPLIVIAAFIVGFLKIHPFLDGNGRLSRVLTNLLLLQAGYAYIPYVSLEKLVEESKGDYYVALRRSQTTFNTESESIAPWVEYFLNVSLKQAKHAMDLLSAEDIESLLSPQQLKVWGYLGGVQEATPGQIAEHTGVARPTVSQALSRLLDMNRVERIGRGSTTRYRKL